MRIGAGFRLLINAGLAAAIAALGGLVGAIVAQQGGGTQRRCELAAAYLQDDSPNPNVSGQQRQLVNDAAVARFRSCMRE